MTSDEAKANLRTAMRDLLHSIAEVGSQLNTTKAECECCHLARFEDYEAYKMHEELSSLSDKIIRLSQKLK